MDVQDEDFDPEYDVEPSSSSWEAPLLPTLSGTPKVHFACCLALSAPLLANIHILLPSRGSLVLSIGSGYGLLEALLLSQPYNLEIVGVEVQPSSNRYLPASRHRIVHGTRSTEPLAAGATAWLFVYPRRVGLVEEYLATYGGGAVKTVLWMGPAADWADYKGCFANYWNVQVKSADEMGGRVWEVIAVATKMML